jgi:hypothetical protein
MADIDPFEAMGGGVQVNGGWLPKNHPGAQQYLAQQPSAPQQAAPLPTGAPAGAGGTTNATSGDINQAYKNSMQSLLTGPTPQQAQQNVITSPAMTAYRQQAQKGESRDRAFLAERQAAQGFGASGATESGIMGLRQARGFGEAQFAGGLAERNEQGRRDELLKAMAMAFQMGDNESARALQAQLGNANIDLQRNQYQDQLGFNYANLQNQMNVNPLAALIGGL